jgi:CHASE2 domain-containing sensor protein
MDERFYVLLAVVIAATILVDFTFTRLIGALDGTKFDQLIHYRLASPVASPDIVIVDIDERSLASVGAERGRWPWPRDVLAEAIATIAEAGPRALFVNVIISEPDPANPDADRTLQEVGAAYPRVVYPFVRLPAENDRHSQLDAAQLPNARPLAGRGLVPDPVAVVLPAFADLQGNLGAANLYQDADGIIRSYEYWLHTDAHALPSATTAMLLAAGAELPPSGPGPLPRLNWRNKRGDYVRVSFADLYDGIHGRQALDAMQFSGKFVVLGASAAGIAVVKATSAEIATDDNTIIATALDDALSGTALRQVPPAVNVVLACALIALFAWGFVAQVDQAKVDTVFALAQASLVAITFISVSYTTVILDMTLPFKAAAAYFVVARSFHAAKHASQRGVARFWDAAHAQRADRAVVIASQGDAESRLAMARVRKALEREIGFPQVLHLSDFIDRSTFLGHQVGDIELIVGFLEQDASSALATLAGEARAPGLNVIEVDLSGKDVEASREALWHAVVAGVFAARGR